MTDLRTIVERFVRTSERCAWTSEIAGELLHPDYVQTELPNLLNRKGQTSNVAETLARNELAKAILASQSYTISSIIESGDTVVVEARWSGELRVAAGAMRAGQKLEAFFCMVFDFLDGRIHRIRNYDCFAPF